MINDSAKLPLNIIEPNPNQPRKIFDEAKLKSLAQSISELGVIQPIVVEIFEVTGEGVRYIIHDGERRWRAAKIAGLEEIPCVISATDNGADIASEDERLSRALVANLQREDLNPIEVAQGYQDLHDLGLSDAQIAKKVGSSRSTVANARRLLNLPDEVRQPIAQGQISERQAQALLTMYQLPAVLLKKAAKGQRWQGTPKILIQAALEGRNSTSLRNDISQMISHHTRDITEVELAKHIFNGDGGAFQSPDCRTCPILVKREKKTLCPDNNCLNQKIVAWQKHRLAEASNACGLKILPELDDLWSSAETFSGHDREAADQFISAGCPHDNLRLRHQPRFAHYPSVAGYPDVKIVCFHGEGKRCKCLAAVKREQTKNDPALQAEKEAKQRLENEIVTPAAQLLATALGENSPDAWRLLVPRMSHRHLNDCRDWNLEKIHMTIASVLIDTSVPWNGYQDLDDTRRRVQGYLGQAGLALPDDENLARIKNHLDRILAWMETLSDETTPEQLEDNFRNLNELVDALDALEAETEAQEQEIRRYIGQIAAALETIMTVRDERSPAKQII